MFRRRNVAMHIESIKNNGKPYLRLVQARTMFHILYAAGHAHTAVIAPALYAFAAKSAALAVAVIYKAVAAIDAVAIVVLGAL